MIIPIELFITFLASSLAFAVFGFLRNPQIPAMMLIAGIFILFIAITTDEIIMRHESENIQFTNSTGTGNQTNTDYSYVKPYPVTFEFTETPKMIFALLGAIIMLSAGIMGFRGNTY